MRTHATMDRAPAGSEDTMMSACGSERDEGKEKSAGSGGKAAGSGGKGGWSSAGAFTA
jgi:hypothetical protein